MKRFSWPLLVVALASPAAFADDPASAPIGRGPDAPVTARPTDLFDRLAATKDPTEAAGIVAALNRMWLVSGSDTSDLLMSRAIQAINSQNYPLALSLLDATIDLQPDWAEAWNKRATVRYLAGDAEGSMADIAQTLKREPRHLGALAGLGVILKDAGRLDDALRAYDRALTIAPEYEPMKDAATRLKAELAGRSL